MKIVTYNHEDISGVMSALEKIRTSGIDQAKLIVYIAGVLESGEVRNRNEPPGAKGVKENETD